MLLLIDGYNLIKNSSSTDFISDSLRKYYVNQINSYCKRKGHKAILVFDGGIFAFASKEIAGLVTVIYSGYKSNADNVIKDFMTENKSKDLLLVSSDRDLQKFGKSLKIEFVSAKEFNNYLFTKDKQSEVDKIKVQDQAVKISSQENKELDELMNRIANVEIIKEDDIISNKHSKADSVSKNQKQLIKKIKKL